MRITVTKSFFIFSLMSLTVSGMQKLAATDYMFGKMHTNAK